MYPNAAILEQLANTLNKQYAEHAVKEIFSTSKLDLYIIFDDDRGIKFQIFEGIGFFQFFEESNFTSKNKLHQFKTVHSLTIKHVNAHKNSRSFDFEFEGGLHLVFKLFGKFTNVILYDNLAKDMFCLNNKKDLSVPYDAFLDKRQSMTDEFTNEKPVFLIKTNNNGFDLSFEDAPGRIEKYDNIKTALNDFSRLYIASESFRLKKQNKLTQLERRIKQKKNLIHDTQQSIENIRNKRSYSQLADLLMSNLHSIHSGTSRVEVYDFYNQSKIYIKIKEDLSPQQNAEFLYKKSKNESKELIYKEKALLDMRHQLMELEQALVQLQSVTDAKSLKDFDKLANQNQHVFPKEKIERLPFKSLKIEGYDVLVGKSAKDNDELLSKFAHKNDVWLHAKDVSGSHVIIKNQDNKPIPMDILEKVASLAAWYSKAKNQQWVTVIYTARKYVRKPKGATPGLVIVEKEKGILVNPSSD
jgi:predicted ribosome quality control (RQC) complex YloA/Tae2 family protein